MNFKLYFVDKEDQGFLKEARREYEKRLSRYCRLEIIHVKTPRMLRKKIDRSIPLIVISEGKALLSSEALAERIDRAELRGISKATVVIGADFEDLCSAENGGIKIAVSPMCVSDCLLSVIFLEQIYRAYRILKNEPYHK